MNHKLFIIILFTCVLACQAQVFKRPVIIEPKLHTGMILPFYKAIAYLVEEDIYAVDIAVCFPTYSNNYWERLYRYPRSGLGYSFWNLGNNEVFGYAHALYGFVNIPIIKHTEKISLNYQISFGGAYLTKRFDLYKNHLNRAISSHANMYIRLGINTKIKLLPRLELLLEAGGTHFSNGKTRSPNYGINAGTLSLGINYLIGTNKNPIRDPEIPVFGKRYVQSLIYSAGGKVFDNLVGRRYFISSLSYNIDRLINYKRRIGLGADFFYDGSISEALAADDGTPEKDFNKLLRFGLHASHAIQYKKLLMGIQLGYYLYSQYTDLTSVYSRISIEYLLSKHITSKISVKSHMAKADYIEWGVGYYW